MDTVSGRLCKYSRIAFRSPKDAYIEMPSLDSTTGRVLGEALTEALQQEEVGKEQITAATRDNRVMNLFQNSNKTKCRFIKKSGHCNVSHSHVADKPSRYLSDIFTTCVDLRWRWNLLLFSAAFIISWLIFAIAYWVASFLHGDFDFQSYQIPGFNPCVNNLEPNASFTSSFLFSLETQTTIGYGYRVVTEECPVTVIFVVVQSVFGCVIDAFMIGLIMAKISRPKKRAETLLFSDKAVVNMRDGQLCLMVRVGNLRKSHLVEATIRMQYLYTRETAEGEFIPLEQLDLRLDLKNDSDRLFLVTPQTICHPIDKDSPLYNLGPDDLHSAQFEVIVILEGMVEATGMTTQARASYLPDEILWGYRFENVISFSSTRGYNVDFCKFNSTYLTPDYPKSSAKDYFERGISLETIRGTNEICNVEDNKYEAEIIKPNEQENISEGRDSGFNNGEDVITTCSNQTLTSSCGNNCSALCDFNEPKINNSKEQSSSIDVIEIENDDVVENNKKNLVNTSSMNLSNSQNFASMDSFKGSQTIVDSLIQQDEPKTTMLEQPLVPNKIEPIAVVVTKPINATTHDNIEVA